MLYNITHHAHQNIVPNEKRVLVFEGEREPHKENIN